MRRPLRLLALVAIASLALGREGAAQRRPIIPMDPALATWFAATARPLPSMDAPYADSSYAWLGPFIGRARLLALGETIHLGHEPLAFRNHAIRYAVTQLGFTGVAIESGFTEGEAIDRFIQGAGAVASIDSILDAGISYGFSRLPENRALVLWLREHNQTARHRVHFYGIDQSGVGEADMGGPAAFDAALALIASLDPAAAQRHRAALAPFRSRFTVGSYPSYTPDERRALHAALVALAQSLARDSARYARATSPAAVAMAARHAWAALRLEEAFMTSGTEGPRATRTIRLRDSVMAENTKWALQQQGLGGKLVVFAHNGHALNVPLDFPAMGPPMVMMGQRLRHDLGDAMRSIGTSSDAYVGLGDVLQDLSSFEGALATVRGGNWWLDLRTADRLPAVSARLRAPWLTRIHAWRQPFVPRTTMDAVVVLDTVRMTTLRAPR
ncbi:MAG: erythromycin esterase family protein [Gemmatimonadaceae bacterium]